MIDIVMFIAGIILVFWFMGHAMGLLLMLLVAGLVGFAAEALAPGPRVSGGWMGAMGAGLIGSWLGTKMIGHVGPALMGVQLVPALIGAIVLVTIVSLLRRRSVS